MGEFIQVLISESFMQYALLAGILASIACGIVGTYVVVKKIGYITGGIAHSVLGGMGIAYFFGFNPIHGAIATAIFAAVIIGLVSLKAKQHEDTIISVIWSIGMAVGIIFISRSPGYNIDLMSYLFGNILMVSKQNLLLIAILDLVIIVIILMLHKRLQAICFDEEYATIQGINVGFTYILLLVLIALTVVILIQVVGLILVIALITLPAAIAGQFAKSMVKMMIIAVLLGLIITTTGLAVSYQPNLPAGATIILTAGLFYLISIGIKKRIFLIFLRKNKNS
jgi:zinc transport system permease protein